MVCSDFKTWVLCFPDETELLGWLLRKTLLRNRPYLLRNRPYCSNVTILLWRHHTCSHDTIPLLFLIAKTKDPGRIKRSKFVRMKNWIYWKDTRTLKVIYATNVPRNRANDQHIVNTNSFNDQKSNMDTEFSRATSHEETAIINLPFTINISKLLPLTSLD